VVRLSGRRGYRILKCPSSLLEEEEVLRTPVQANRTSVLTGVQTLLVTLLV